jgi:hypothetical protein
MVTETMDAIKELNQLALGLDKAISHFDVSEEASRAASGWNCWATPGPLQ